MIIIIIKLEKNLKYFNNFNQFYYFIILFVIFINHVYCKPQNTAIKYTKSNTIKQYFKILEFKSISILLFIGICWTIFRLEYGGGGSSFAIVYEGESSVSWSIWILKKLLNSPVLISKKNTW